MGMKIEGLDELVDYFEDLSKKAESLKGERQVSFDELFTEEFMAEHTNFKTMDELLISGGFKVESTEDFEAIPEDEFDEHIQKVTNFNTWEEMLQEAGSQYYINQVDL